jgi:uncharacterized membrane protein (UPF0127 family)
MKMKVLHEKSKKVLGVNITPANSFYKKLMGMMFQKEFNGLDGMIFNTQSIHTFFMAIPIDVLFLNKELKVIKVYRNLKPWRMTRIYFTASKVIELPAGSLPDEIQSGDQIRIENV